MKNINYEEIEDLLREQIGKIMLDYKDYSFVLTTERQFNGMERTKNMLYFIVKFLPATIDFGQITLPFLINAVSEQNKFDVCRQVMTTLAEEYNLKYNEENTILQAYTTPNVNESFGEIYNGFRAVLSMSGTMLISQQTNPFTCVYENENLPTITSNFSFSNDLDPRGIFNNGNMTKSEAKVGTRMLNISLYLTDSDLINKCLQIVNKEISNNTIFPIIINFKNGKTISTNMKLYSIDMSKEIAAMPLCVIVFTE